MIEVTHSGGLWTVTLNRPDKANALNRKMLQDLGDAALAAHQDPDLRSFIVTGAGDRVFCAGADTGSEDMQSFTRDPVWTRMSDAIWTLPCLTIAALNGTLAGGGFAAALACDIRIATPQAKFFYPVLKRGFLPQPADVSRLAALINPARARMILMAGQKIDAVTAYDWGLVDRVVPLADFADTLAELTADATAATPAHVCAMNAMFSPDLSAEDLQNCYAATYDQDASADQRLRSRLCS